MDNIYWKRMSKHGTGEWGGWSTRQRARSGEREKNDKTTIMVGNNSGSRKLMVVISYPVRHENKKRGGRAEETSQTRKREKLAQHPSVPCDTRL